MGDGMKGRALQRVPASDEIHKSPQSAAVGSGRPSSAGACTEPQPRPRQRSGAAAGEGRGGEGPSARLVMHLFLFATFLTDS